MKIRNLFPIRYILILFALLSFVILVACSAEKKETENRKRAEEHLESMNQARTPEPYKSFDPSPPEKGDEKKNENKKETLCAVVNENNIKILSGIDGDIFYLHRGDVVYVYAETNEDDPDMYELSSSKGLIHGKHLNFISLSEKYGAETTMTNSKEVNHNGFPLRETPISEFIGREGGDIPAYLESVDDWVVFSKLLELKNSYCLSIHLKNLPQQFDVLIYTPDESRYLKYSGKKKEFPIALYKDFFDLVLNDRDKDILDRILPFYVFYYQAPLTAVSGKQKTEIRSRDNNLIFSTYLDYPAEPFRLTAISGRSIYLQYCTDTPFYLAIYRTLKDTILSPLDLKRIPVKAFAAYPENGLWSALLTLGSYGPESVNTERNYIYLYRLDENNPEDYTQRIDEYEYFRF